MIHSNPLKHPRLPLPFGSAAERHCCYRKRLARSADILVRSNVRRFASCQSGACSREWALLRTRMSALRDGGVQMSPVSISRGGASRFTFHVSDFTSAE
ncbi:MAG: hypothetical protein C5B50_28400 [Verrucomicrobia bacterium]|nr:MAG: hypothetical protein C5B50_28400 [Verrucomicrobiota bacterium]